MMVNTRWTLALVLVGVTAMAVAASNNQQKDFLFESTAGDEGHLQFMDSESDEIESKSTSLYEKDASGCSSNASKLMLTLVLRSNSWDDLIAKKQTRAVQKLALFFNIPPESINLENVSRTKLQKTTLIQRQGPNNLGEAKKYGKLEFQVGCQLAVFDSCRPIVSQIQQQMADGSIDEISGLSFGWWLLRSEPARQRQHDRTPRRARRAAADAKEVEGSGDDDYYYDEDEEEPITETPVDSHPHRHHHGLDSDDSKTTDTAQSTVGSDQLPPPIDPEIRASVDKLESDIIKTIANNDRLKEAQLEIEKLGQGQQWSEPDGLDEEQIDEDDDDEIVAVDEAQPDIQVKPSSEKPAEDDEEEPPLTTISVTPLVVITESQSVNEVVPTTSSTSTTTPQAPTTTPSVAPPIATTTPKTTTAKAAILSSTTETVAKSSTTVVAIEEETTPLAGDRKTKEDASQSYSSTGSAAATTPSDNNDYDDIYDDYDDEPKTTQVTPATTEAIQIEIISPTTTPSTTPATTTPVSTTETTTLPSTVAITTPTTTEATTTATTTTSAPTTSTTQATTTEYIEPEPLNNSPIIRNRLPKLPVTAGKSFTSVVPLETFFDTEDGTNLRLTLLDRNDNELKANSWVQYNPETREIYGLPLEDAVSKWQFHLRATDSGNETVTESLDIAVQQHKAHRSANHEISVVVRLNEKFTNSIDWQISLMHGIAEALGDPTLASIVVREVRQSALEPNSATFVFTNDTLPKDVCPEQLLDDLFQKLNTVSLTDAVQPQLTVKSVSVKPIGPCAKSDAAKPKVPKPTPQMTKNYPPVPRNQVDRVNATTGQLLVFKVPADTFYDPEDTTDLKLSLLTMDRAPLDARHWLQFDSKNQEFYGIPKFGDIGQKEFLLVAEDREGLTATDALVVVVGHANHRDINGLFELTLGIPYDEFNNAAIQRRFVERIAQIFGDSTTAHIQIRAIRKIHQTGQTMVHFFNNTLHRSHHVCPTEIIQQLKNVLVHPDGSTRHRVTDTLGAELRLEKVAVVPMGACLHSDDAGHIKSTPILKPAQPPASGSSKDDYLLTFVIPAVIIIAMLLLATIIACVLHRRRMTGKMEIGDEEERRSFRSKGIPVIFHDELDEKPEAGNKSPVILKDEKPPLLPPSYNTINPEDHEDMDEYVPPPAVVMNGRESRGKSPVTPSYRKPPPYVSP